MKSAPSFRYPDPKQFRVEMLNRKWARVKLPKLGWVSFRISRPLGGVVKSATLARDGDHWFIAFRADFNAQCAHRLTRDFALVGLEKLNTKAMTASAAGTVEQPGTNVAQKRGLNKSILNKGWYGLEAALRSKARYTSTKIIVVPAAYSSQACSRPDCGRVDAASRESQARFVCTACGFVEHADVNAGCNVRYRTLVAAGLAVPGRGDLQAPEPGP